jgi:hypothetical protein
MPRIYLGPPGDFEKTDGRYVPPIAAENSILLRRII